MTKRPSTWRAMLECEWRWTRALLFLAAVLAFGLPLLSVRVAANTDFLATFIATMASWGVAYAVTAGTLGLMVAVVTWGFDHRLRHVYALSLPIARWRYVLLRYSAGLLMLVIPVAALLVSAELVAHSKLVPPTLHAYPVALTLRFSFALFVVSSLFFVVATPTPRTAGYILGAIALVIVTQVVLSSASVQFNLISRMMDAVFAAPGLLAVFGGRWALIDV
jgi:hypothetical protein